MKKSKLLIPIVGLVTSTVVVAPLASCAPGGDSSSTNHIKSVDKKTGELTNSYVDINITLDKHYSTSELSIKIIAEKEVTDQIYIVPITNGSLLTLELRTKSTSNATYEFGLEISNGSNWTETITGFKFGYVAPKITMYINGSATDHSLDTKVESYQLTVKASGDGGTEKEVPATIKVKDTEATPQVVSVVGNTLFPLHSGSAVLVAEYPGYKTVEFEVAVYSKGEVKPEVVEDPETGETCIVISVSDEARQQGTTGTLDIPEKIYVEGQGWIQVLYIGDLTDTDYDTINIPRTVKGFKGTESGKGSCEGNENLKNVNIEKPSQMKDVGEYTFKGSGITSFDLSNTEVVDYPKGVTQDCPNLTKVVVGDKTKTLCQDSISCTDPETGEGTGSVTDIDLGNVETIEKGALKGQKNLQNITIPSTVKDTTDPQTGEKKPGVGDDAFTGCGSLHEVTIDSKDTWNLVEGGTIPSSGKEQTSTSLFGDNQGASEKVIDPETGEEKWIGPRATVVYLPEGTEPDPDSFIAMNYTNQGSSSKSGYDIWVPKDNKEPLIIDAKHNLDIVDDVENGTDIHVYYQSTEVSTAYPVELAVPIDANHFKLTSGDDIVDLVLDPTNQKVTVKPKGGDKVGTACVQVSFPEYRYKSNTFNFAVGSFTNIDYTGGKASAKATKPTGEIYIPTEYYPEDSNSDTAEPITGFKATDAFKDCTGITKIHLNQSMNDLGTSGTFDGCTSLTDVDIPAACPITTVGLNTFHNCSELTMINLPTTVTSIGESAFHIDSSLGKLDVISFPNVQSIGKNAFRNQGLTSVTIPESLDASKGGSGIGVNAFTNCPLNNVIVDSQDVASLSASAESSADSTDLYSLTGNLKVKTSVVGNIPSDSYIKTYFNVQPNPDEYTSYTATTEIVLTDYAQNFDINDTTGHVFKATCKGRPVDINLNFPQDLLKEVTAANGDKKLVPLGVAGSGTITVTSGTLTPVSVPFEVATYDNLSFTTKTGAKASVSVDSEKKSDLNPNVIIPNNWYKDKVAYTVNEISSTAFTGCGTLQTISLPGTIEALPDNCFDTCTSLTSAITTGSDHLSAIKTIGSKAFNGCSAMTSFKLGKKVTTLGSYAFADSGLTGENAFTYDDVDTSKTVFTTIGAYAFKNTGLTKFHVLEKTTSVDSTAFEGCASFKTSYIDNETVAKSSSHTLFSAVSKINIYIKNGVYTPASGSYLYEHCIKKADEAAYTLYRTTSGIAISTNPTKMTYRVLGGTGGTSWTEAKYDASGLRVKVTDDQEEQTEEIDPTTDARFSVNLQRREKGSTNEFANASPSGTDGCFTRADADGYDWRVHVSFEGKEAWTAEYLSFWTLESISVKTQPKVDYNDGDYFNPSGIVLEGTFKNGTESKTEELTSQHQPYTYAITFDTTSETPSWTTITTSSVINNTEDSAKPALIQVTATEGNVTKTCTYPITVQPFKWKAISNFQTNGTYWSNVWQGNALAVNTGNTYVYMQKLDGTTESNPLDVFTSMEFSVDNRTWKTYPAINGLYFDSTSTGYLYGRYKKPSGAYLTATQKISYTPKAKWNEFKILTAPKVSYHTTEEFDPSTMVIQVADKYTASSHSYSYNTKYSGKTRAEWETLGFKFYVGNTELPTDAFTYDDINTFNGKTLTVKYSGAKNPSTLSVNSSTISLANFYKSLTWNTKPSDVSVEGDANTVLFGSVPASQAPISNTLTVKDYNGTTVRNDLTIDECKSEGSIPIGSTGTLKYSYEGCYAADVSGTGWWTWWTATNNLTLTGKGMSQQISCNWTTKEQVTIFTKITLSGNLASGDRLLWGNNIGGSSATTKGANGLYSSSNKNVYLRYRANSSAAWNYKALSLGQHYTDYGYLLGVSLPSEVTSLTSGECEVLSIIAFGPRTESGMSTTYPCAYILAG